MKGAGERKTAPRPLVLRGSRLVLRTSTGERATSEQATGAGQASDERPAAAFTPKGLRVSEAGLKRQLGGAGALGRLLGSLTVAEKPQPGRPKNHAVKKRAAFRREGGDLFFPKAKAQALAGLARFPARDDSLAPCRAVPAEKLEPARPFYEYQAAAAGYVGGVFEACSKNKRAGQVYVQMGTGMGKTSFGLAVAARGGGPAFVVVPTKAIRDQWLDECCTVFPGLRAAPYDNAAKAPAKAATHDFVVGVVNTVRRKPAGFFAGYATVILDEAHELCSPENLKVLWLAQGAPRVLGLSATPEDNPSGLDRVVYHFLGRPVRAEEDIPGVDVAAVRFKGRARGVEYSGGLEYCEAVVGPAGTVSAVETIGRLVRDPARLRLVASEVARLHNLHLTEADPGRLSALGLGPRPAAAATAEHPEGGVRRHGVFVFAEHREYLPALREALLEYLPPAEVALEEDEQGPAVVLRGGASRAQVGRAHRARVVLTTYGYSRRGVSLVDMTAIVLATPRRNGMQQILGRITRRGSDESIVRQVVDIRDTRSALKSQSAARLAVYREKGYPVTHVRADFARFAEEKAPPLPEGVAEKPKKEKPAGRQEEGQQAQGIADVYGC